MLLLCFVSSWDIFIKNLFVNKHHIFLFFLAFSKKFLRNKWLMSNLDSFIKNSYLWWGQILFSWSFVLCSLPWPYGINTVTIPRPGRSWTVIGTNGHKRSRYGHGNVHGTKDKLYQTKDHFVTWTWTCSSSYLAVCMNVIWPLLDV